MPEKYSQNLCFQTLRESHKSQQLVLNSNLGVKWKGRNYEKVYMQFALYPKPVQDLTQIGHETVIIR